MKTVASLREESLSEFMANRRLLFAPTFICKVSPFPEVIVSGQGGDTFSRENGRDSVSVVCHDDYGMPYGIFCRFLLILITTVGCVKKTTEIDFGSIAQVLDALRTPKSAEYYRVIRKQILALSHCIMCIRHQKNNRIISIRNHFPVKESISEKVSKDGLWPTRIVLSDDFLADALRSAMPVKPEVLTSLRSPLALDVYLWISWRSGSISGPLIRIGWHNLRNQFGSQTQSLRAFRSRFLRMLTRVELVYPELSGRYSADAKHFILLKLSSPVRRGLKSSCG